MSNSLVLFSPAREVATALISNLRNMFIGGQVIVETPGPWLLEWIDRFTEMFGASAGTSVAWFRAK